MFLPRHLSFQSETDAHSTAPLRTGKGYSLFHEKACAPRDQKSLPGRSRNRAGKHEDSSEKPRKRQRRFTSSHFSCHVQGRDRRIQNGGSLSGRRENRRKRPLRIGARLLSQRSFFLCLRSFVTRPFSEICRFLPIVFEFSMLRSFFDCLSTENLL